LAHEPARVRAKLLVDKWTKLQFSDVLRVNMREVLGLARNLFGLRRRWGRAGEPGGLINPAGLEGTVRGWIRFDAIQENLEKGRLQGLSLSATHVATGRTIVFVQVAKGKEPSWSPDMTIIPRVTSIEARHVLASAAVPILFPPVNIDGEYFCDGGLRHNVPLSPARRLGADRLLVVNPRYAGPRKLLPAGAGEGRPSLLFSFGKALNAMLLDRVDNDIDRLHKINTILDAGTRRFGPRFVPELNSELGYPEGKGLRPLDVMLVRASEDIGKMAGDFVRSPSFRSRAPGLLGRMLRRLADSETSQQSDLISYLLFDGGFARQLIELGRRDAKARHDELCAFFAAK
jgi:NTE family protein